MKKHDINRCKRCLSLAFFAVIFFTSCKKNQETFEMESGIQSNSVVYVARATIANSIAIYPGKDTTVNFNFGANFGALGLPKDNIPVKFMVDEKAFDSVNVVRQKQGLAAFQKFPADAYKINDLSATISQGQTTSNLIALQYNSSKFNPVVNYMLAVSLVNASGYTINPNAKTIVITTTKYKVPELKAASTGWGITASSSQAGEGSLAAVLDGDLATYWHSQYSPTQPVFPHWIQLDMLSQINITSISLSPRPAPNNTGFTKFNLEGSVDGAIWVKLLTDKTMNPATKSLQNYELDIPTRVRYLKLIMTESPNPYTSLSEFQVFRPQ